MLLVVLQAICVNFCDRPTVLETYPDNNQGYGRVQINKVLNFFGPAQTSPLTLFVIGDTNTSSPLHRSLSTGQSDNYSFSVATSQEVRVVLAFVDPPSSTSSTVMVNSLGVSVVDTTGNVFSPDPISITNTFQVITFTASADIIYTAKVSGDFINALHSPQPYALVMVASLGLKRLPDTTEDHTLLSSSLSINDLPYMNAIIALTVIAGILILITSSVFIVETLAMKQIIFRLRRW